MLPRYRSFCYGIGTWLLFWTGGCASLGPVIPVAPELRVTGFNSVAIRPDGIRFEAKVAIKNRMPVPVPLDRFEYQVDLNGKRLATGAFTQFEAFGGNAEQTVTLPFHLAWQDIVGHALAKASDQGYRVGLNGSLYVAAGGFPFPPIPITIEKTLPVPKWPVVRIAGTEGSPLGEKFLVKFNIRNDNSFPIWVSTVESHVQLNRKTYPLAAAGAAPRCEPGETQVLALAMTNTLSKGLDMFANVLLSGKMDFKVGGSVGFGTPFGEMVLPLDGQGKTQ
jgi:LEA14-like dessication related protein